jgi:AcrR family transcriptional regulator
MRMKSNAAEKRPYRQGARAEAAEATGRRIAAVFVEAMRDRWLEDITLDQVAEAAGVTVQTVIRRFGGKEGLLRAARDHIGGEVLAVREAPVGDLERAVANVCADYESTGDMIGRLLAQEKRFPDLKPFLDFGRNGHRAWVSEVAAPWLEGLDRKAREAALDSLVAALDVYVWQLLRRDLGRSAEATRKTMLRLARGVVDQIQH